MPIKTPQVVSPLPLPPNPADRSTFNTRAYPWSEALAPWTDQVNQLAADTYANAVDSAASATSANASKNAAAGSASAASTDAGLASGYRTEALASKNAAASSASTANTSRAQAVTAKNEAQQWATSLTTVSGGLKGARGYANDAAQSATEAAQSASGAIAPSIHAATAKTTPADADELPIVDSTASWSLKKLTWGKLKTSVWAAFKTIATGSSAKATLGLGTAATRDVGTGSGNVMQVGAFGLGVDGVQIPIGADLNTYTTNGFYAVDTNAVAGSILNSPVSASFGLTVLPIGAFGANSSFQILKVYNTRHIWTRYATQGNWSAWFEILHTDNILTTTGQSTQYPMTQKAVTDAINNSVFGAGQTWQDVTSSRVAGTTYTNTTGRPIAVSVVGSIPSARNLTLYVDSVMVAKTSVSGVSIAGNQFFAIVPAGSTYSASRTDTTVDIIGWAELR